MQQVNKRENMNPIVQEVDELFMANSKKLLKDYETHILNLEGILSILQDRIIESTELGFPIAFAKVGELQLQALKQKNDVLKNLLAYKANETASARKGPGELSISDLLNSAALGAGMGAKLNMSGQQPKIIDASGKAVDFVDAIIEDVSPVQVRTSEEIADSLMKDFT